MRKPSNQQQLWVIGQLWQVSKIASAFDVPVSTLKSACDRGDIKVNYLGDGTQVVYARDVRAFLANRPKRGPKKSVGRVRQKSRAGVSARDSRGSG